MGLFWHSLIFVFLCFLKHFPFLFFPSLNWWHPYPCPCPYCSLCFQQFCLLVGLCEVSCSTLQVFGLGPFSLPFGFALLAGVYYPINTIRILGVILVPFHHPFVRGFGCSSCWCVHEVKGCLDSIWDLLSMFHSKVFLDALLIPLSFKFLKLTCHFWFGFVGSFYKAFGHMFFWVPLSSFNPTSLSPHF
jgi:hypothetical protein